MQQKLKLNQMAACVACSLVWTAAMVCKWQISRKLFSVYWIWVWGWYFLLCYVATISPVACIHVISIACNLIKFNVTLFFKSLYSTNWLLLAFNCNAPVEAYHGCKLRSSYYWKNAISVSMKLVAWQLKTLPYITSKMKHELHALKVPVSDKWIE